ncbi:MAG: prepilin-type N-terminal cleavage/methylation domain-containing protein [Kiritimatiellae bacterium]|nr:prepilin-type N-terminal cleavage/methylation domain-containing protein [Kiritimatiellia bacterium]
MKTKMCRDSFSCCGTAGFTLVEIMIVVCIIGMLSAVAIPSMRKSRVMSQVAAVSNDLRVLGDAFNQYSIEHGTYPDGMAMGLPAGDLPPGLSAYIDSMLTWTDKPHCGGKYVWYGKWPDGVSLEVWGITSPSMATEIDKQMDNGNPNSGRVKVVAGGTRLWYFLEVF